jgi:hypothetical protein
MAFVKFQRLKELGLPFADHRRLLPLEEAGEFPKRVTFGSRKILWVEKEIDAHFEKLLAHQK